MAYHEWLTALLVACSLGPMGALPKVVPLRSAAAFVQRNEPIRIGLAQYARAVKVVACGSARVTLTTDEGPRRLALQPGQALWARADGDAMTVEAYGNATACRGVRIDGSGAGLRLYSWGAAARSGLAGERVEVALDAQGTLSAIGVLGLEEYLCGVVPVEMSPSFHYEALKAQAIIARTYALFNLGKHLNQGFDLCDGMHCQQYRAGVRSARARCAVMATAGLVLAYRGCLAETVYHTVCGGYVDDSHRVWQGYLMPYLRAARDGSGGWELNADAPREEQVARFIAAPGASYCAASPRYRWRRSYSIARAQRLLEANLGRVTGAGTPVGNLLDMETQGRSPGGRVQTLRIVTDRGEHAIRRNDIRWLFGDGRPGPGGLPSTLFALSRERDNQGRVVGFVLEGLGWGHGLGLCQYGAEGRARAGASARAILEAYYPGTQIVDLRR